MPVSRSFKEYVSSRFYNELFDAVAEYISDSAGETDLRLYRIRRPGEIELEDVYVRTISVSDLPGSAISFDAALEAELCVHEADYRYDETEGCRQWFMLHCRGDLACSLDDFAIDGIAIYSGKTRQPDPLDDSLVPVIGTDDLEEKANEFLKKHYPQALLRPMYVDPMELAAGMGLDVKTRRITDDCSVFGQIFFADCRAEFYDRNSGEPFTEDVKAKTIVVDPDTYFLYNLGKANNTIVHECVHWDLHRKAYELERLYDSEASQIRCRAAGGAAGNSKAAAEWMEWQANALAPRIQMPLAMFRQQATKCIRKIRQTTGKFDLIDIIEPVIESLSVFFGVSRLAAKIRMLDAGFEEAAGAFIFVDGRYARPCIAKKGSAGINQTFTLGWQDAAIQRAVNPELRELAKDGDYLFVENHYVYNAPLYVEYNEEGELGLTGYARTHMDECCLLFDIAIKSSVRSDYYSVCYLNREQSDITFELTFHNGYENAPKERQIAYRRKMKREEIEIRAQMTDDPKQCMELLLNWRGVSYTELAERVHRSPRTVSRTVNGESVPELKTAVLICFALNLPPSISGKLLDVWGCRLSPVNQEHQWISEALQTKYPESLKAVRRYLEQYGVNLN